MARLIDVCRSNENAFSPRQLPITIEPNLVMLMQFPDICSCDSASDFNRCDYNEFIEKYNSLTDEELTAAITVTSRQLLSDLTLNVSCIGCRRCVEMMFSRLTEFAHIALDPLVVSADSTLTVNKECRARAKLYLLLYGHSGRFRSIMSNLFPKNRKVKRCTIHSLEMHKTKSLGIWPDVWDALSRECKEEVTIIEYSSLSVALNEYLRKHRFCGECKNKVLRAYRLLTKEETFSPSDKTAAYNRALYNGLSACPTDEHVHVDCDEKYIRSLINRAEPEIKGSDRERHAKTMEVAQEEVLTCIGLLLYDRFYVIWHKLRTEEQAWQILFTIGVDQLRKNFELAIEHKRGISKLEQTCLELIGSEEQQEKRRVLKRLKKKKNHLTASSSISSCTSSTQSQDVSSSAGCTSSACSADDDKQASKYGHCVHADQLDSSCSSPATERHKSALEEECAEEEDTQEYCSCTDGPVACGPKSVCGERQQCVNNNNNGRGASCHGDCGYSSGLDGNDGSGSSVYSSAEGSDVVCSEACCNNDNCIAPEAQSMQRAGSVDCQSCAILTSLCHDAPLTCHSLTSSCHNAATGCHDPISSCPGRGNVGSLLINHKCNELRVVSHRFSSSLSLLDMLQNSYSSDEEKEDDGHVDSITEEEIERFRNNRKLFEQQRSKLRLQLRENFDRMTRRCLCIRGRTANESDGGCMTSNLSCDGGCLNN